MENLKQFTLPVVLNGNNYILWSRTTKIALRSRGVWVHCLSSVEMSKDTAEAEVVEEGEGAAGAEVTVEPAVQISSSQEDSKWVQEDQFV
ncbi:hypothetical protein V5N11_033293 [Cardamine amara subsp. amara]